MNGSTPDPGAARYVSLATFRRDGREVRTPVWIAEHGGLWYVFSEGQAGKVKRVRATGRARLAACDARGRVSGEWLEASARLVDDPVVSAAAYGALREKYGWQMWLTDRLSRLTGRYARRVLIEIRPGRDETTSVSR